MIPYRDIVIPVVNEEMKVESKSLTDPAAVLISAAAVVLSEKKPLLKKKKIVLSAIFIIHSLKHIYTNRNTTKPQQQ